MNKSQSKKTHRPENLPTVSRFQRCVAETHRRSEINLAAYNPRKIAGEAKARLHQAIDTFGMVEQLVWNRRTGNLVGGHQRIADLDERHGAEDYALQFSVVDLDERAEKKLNLLLNNKHAQGEWDDTKLSALIGSIERDLAGTGFDEADLVKLFGEVDSLVNADPKLDQAAALLKKWKVQPGQLWALDTHRLLCGDSTKADQFSKLLGDEKLCAIVSDPPYGIAYSPGRGGGWNQTQRWITNSEDIHRKRFGHRRQCPFRSRVPHCTQTADHPLGRKSFRESAAGFTDVAGLG